LKKFDIQIDSDSNTAYIAITNNEVERTISLGEDINIDLDETGAIVGIELLYLNAEIIALSSEPTN
jgi:uncharacterized protein YuzE